MSYTQNVKMEVINKIKEATNKEFISELRGILLIKNSISEDGIELKFENKETSERVYFILKRISKLKIVVKYITSKKFGEHNAYMISIPKQYELKNFIKEINEYSIKNNMGDEEIIRGFIRGNFLGCGYIKSPEKGYALDFFIDNEELANELYELLLFMNKKVSKTSKRNKTLVYLRNAEDIMDIIVLIGSMKEFYNYEETTMIKEIKNKTIREMNWEVANETKTLDTARKQIIMINYIGEKIGLNELSPVLEEVAFLRLHNTEASLQELAELIGISKSGIRNRFRRIEEIYKELLENK